MRNNLKRQTIQKMERSVLSDVLRLIEDDDNDDGDVDNDDNFQRLQTLE